MGYNPDDKAPVEFWYDKGLDKIMDEVSKEIDALNRKKADTTAEIADKVALLLGLMETVNDEESWSFRGEGYTAIYIRPRPRKKLVVERLYEQGVTEEVIRKATKLTEMKPYASVRKRGEEG
jgi:hypothetical protein